MSSKKKRSPCPFASAKKPSKRKKVSKSFGKDRADVLAASDRGSTLQADPFLTVHMLCTEKRLCTNRVKFLLSMLSALLRYSFEPRPDRPGIAHVKCKQRAKKSRREKSWAVATFGTQIQVKVKYEELR